tara:strand:- start:463 stop:753 length:291 start_codon:yes stop_codon:yes gene_type:complete
VRKYAIYAQGNRLLDIPTHRTTRTNGRENNLRWSQVFRLGFLWQKIKRENYLQMKLLIAAILTIFYTSCGVVYKGKYGNYTLTPAGTVIIEPNYAK